MEEDKIFYVHFAEGTVEVVTDSKYCAIQYAKTQAEKNGWKSGEPTPISYQFLYAKHT